MKLNCPMCGQMGYLRIKWIWGSSHFRKLPYWYLQHTKGLAVLPGPSWCYLGRVKYWISHHDGRHLQITVKMGRPLLPNSLKEVEIRPGVKLIEVEEYMEEIAVMVRKAREKMGYDQ